MNDKAVLPGKTVIRLQMFERKKKNHNVSVVCPNQGGTMYSENDRDCSTTFLISTILCPSCRSWVEFFFFFGGDINKLFFSHCHVRELILNLAILKNNEVMVVVLRTGGMYLCTSLDLELFPEH